MNYSWWGDSHDNHGFNRCRDDEEMFNNHLKVCNDTVLDAHADGVGKSFVFSTCSKDSFPRPVGKLVSALAWAQPSLLTVMLLHSIQEDYGKLGSSGIKFIFQQEFQDIVFNSSCRRKIFTHWRKIIYTLRKIFTHLSFLRLKLWWEIITHLPSRRSCRALARI